jgi:uncharacterized protein Yka (UPF0111/DUF47 family)
MRWFLPETPDVVGMLCTQAGITYEGMEAAAAWARGDGSAGELVREIEHRADGAKRELRTALTEAFTTPLDAEDLYVMSERLDAVMNGVKDAVRESELIQIPPDRAVADMADCLAEGVHHLQAAFSALGSRQGGQPATASADAAVKARRRLERVYREGMRALLDVADLREEMGRRELYRRFSRIGDTLAEVADRVWYATVKEG